MINYDGPRRSGKSNKIIRNSFEKAIMGGKVAVITFNHAAAMHLCSETRARYETYIKSYSKVDTVLDLGGGGSITFRAYNRYLNGFPGDFDVVLLDEYQLILSGIFGNVSAIAGTTLKCKMTTKASEDQLKELQKNMSKEQYLKEFICEFKEN